ncbi:GntR family transcriptional regulator [Streptomyces violens]|uniref:GntR family transcriptional regulator n=1 Tax=Streptomyces violens TaxID=66377 RepID=UPI0004BF7A8A|nr:GntR family transcriptional regulator [Streptomyces violens]
MTPPVTRRRQPRVELYERIVAAIHDGTFPPGSNLPSEPELAARLGVSRPALREVLILLQEDGVITRRHGVGSRVNQPPPARGFERLAPIESLLGEGRIACRRRVAEQAEPTDFSGYHLRLPPSSRAWFWETLIEVDGVPVCFAHEWAAEDTTLAALSPTLPAALAAPPPEDGPTTTMLARLLATLGDHPLIARSSTGATTLGKVRGEAMARPAETPAVLVTQTVLAAGHPLLTAKYLLPVGAPLLRTTHRT